MNARKSPKGDILFHCDTYEELLRRLQDITALMYKVKHGFAPDCVSDLFVRTGSTHSPRNSDFVLPRFRSIRYGKHSIKYLGPFLWSKRKSKRFA